MEFYLLYQYYFIINLILISVVIYNFMLYISAYIIMKSEIIEKRQYFYAFY